MRAVDEVTFDVKPGEVLAVVGESGSGKSVSSRAAIGLLPDTARVTGTVLLGDRDVAGLSDKQFTALRGKDIAMVFQEPGSALDPLFTVGYQVSEAVRAHSDMDRKQARERAVELLRMVRLPDPEHRYDYYPHQLSGGQKQRVVIACAIACDPAVIIADEPTTALDVTVQAEILELLRDLRDRLGSAILLITHNMGVVADLADRVVVMNAGRVVEIAPVQQLFAQPSAGLHPHPARGRSAPGSGPARAHVADGARPGRGAGGRPADRGVPRADRRRTVQGRRRRQLHHRTWRRPLAWWASRARGSRRSGAAWPRCRSRRRAP